jgi:hypothetical protein
MINTSHYYKELVSLNLYVVGCDSSGNIHWNGEPNQELADLVVAAHGMPLTSVECLVLKSSITEQQWTSYVEARNAPIKSQRAERYRTEADPVYLKITEDALIANTTPDYSEWLQLKDAIRNDLPYSE